MVSDFFETRLKNVEAPATAVTKSSMKKQNKKNFKKKIAIGFEDSDEDSSKVGKLTRRKNSASIRKGAVTLQMNAPLLSP